MTQKQIQKAQDRLADLYASMEGSTLMDIINEIVELELLLEQECNK